MTDASRWGVDASYDDAFGQRRDVPRQVQAAVLAAMGADEPPSVDSVRVARRGDALPAGSELTLEDGSALGALSRVPDDVPFGYHELTFGEHRQVLIVGPGRCHFPAGLRAWAWAVQLYATRSRASWGIGDLADLRALAEWSAELGAGYLTVNPLNAVAPTLPQQASPYFPSSRRFRNPLYLRVEEVPGASAVPDLDDLAASGRALNQRRLIDRDAVLRLKLGALERIWAAGRPRDDEGLQTYRAERGRPLRSWATFATIAEGLGPAWRSWPEELRRADGGAIERFARAHPERVAFHEWLQWLIDEQLALAASGGVGLVQDLPVGVDRDGFDAWAWQDLLALGVSVGAPPDIFNTTGQDWGLPPFVPHRLRAAGYRPLVDTLRAAMRHAGGLRVDHVMGLFRLWWIPDGNGAADGAYVRYHAEELLEVVALESWRAGVLVVGEDLGTVEPAVREALARYGLLSSRLLYFETGSPRAYPELAMAAVTTHDLPTIAGVWSGSDLDDQARSGVEPDHAGLAQLRERLGHATGLSTDADVREVIVDAHAALAEAPSALVSATLDDALAVEERPNIPATLERPNWSLALPKPIEEIRDDAYVRRVARALHR
jgi:4-alpha-glucanotransferase